MLTAVPPAPEAVPFSKEARNTFCWVNEFSKWFGSGFQELADELDVVVKEKETSRMGPSMLT